MINNKQWLRSEPKGFPSSHNTAICVFSTLRPESYLPVSPEKPVNLSSKPGATLELLEFDCDPLAGFALWQDDVSKIEQARSFVLEPPI